MAYFILGWITKKLDYIIFDSDREVIGNATKEDLIEIHRRKTTKIYPIPISYDKTYVRNFFREYDGDGLVCHNITVVYKCDNLVGLLTSKFELVCVEYQTFLKLHNTYNINGAPLSKIKIKDFPYKDLTGLPVLTQEQMENDYMVFLNNGTHLKKEYTPSFTVFSDDIFNLHPKELESNVTNVEINQEELKVAEAEVLEGQAEEQIETSEEQDNATEEQDNATEEQDNAIEEQLIIDKKDIQNEEVNNTYQQYDSNTENIIDGLKNRIAELEQEIKAIKMTDKKFMNGLNNLSNVIAEAIFNKKAMGNNLEIGIVEYLCRLRTCTVGNRITIPVEILKNMGNDIIKIIDSDWARNKHIAISSVPMDEEKQFNVLCLVKIEDGCNTSEIELVREIHQGEWQPIDIFNIEKEYREKRKTHRHIEI